MKKSPVPSGFAAIVIGSLMLTLAGCGGPAVPRDLMSEEARNDHGDRPVAMRGEGAFAGGNVHVTATVVRGFERNPGQHGQGNRAPKLKKGWFDHDTEAYKEDYAYDFGDSEEQQKEAVKEYIRQAMARRAAGSPMPPVTLHVIFENRGTTPIEIVPTEVNSDLGNFAVRPPKLTLAPGEKGSLEPMVSQLGVTSDDMPLTVTIRVGGKSETQVVQVKNILTPAARAQTGS